MEEDEMKNFIKVWISAVASLTYCYLISSKIPKGKFRFLSIIPIFYFFTILPFNLTAITLVGPTSFFLTWLGNFNLILFSLGKGPLSNSDDPSSSSSSISLPNFISLACLPIKIKNSSSLKSETPKSSPLNLAIKILVLGLLSFVYEHKQNIHPKIMLVYFCCYLYIGLEFILNIVAAMTATLLKLEIEPLFDEPYLSTSLQDFWGRRWNLMVTNILRPTVYEPVRYISTGILGRKRASLPAVFATFLVSGLMHELIFFFLSRVSPTWEVTCFFLLQGFCVALEIMIKKAVNGRWRLHPVVSGPLTVGFVMVTGFWLFFPQLLRCDTDVRISRELGALIKFVKDIGRTMRSLGISRPTDDEIM